MIRSLYLDPSGAQTEGLDEDEIARALKTEGGLLWIDNSEGDREAERLMREFFGFHPLAIEDCFNGRIDTPKVDDFGDHLFIISQSITYDSKIRQLALTEVDLFLGINYVFTSHVAPVPELDDFYARAGKNEHLLNRGADMLAQAVIDTLVDRILPTVEAIDQDLDAMEELVIRRPDRKVLPNLMLMRRLTLRLRRSILPQRDVVNRLSRGEFPRLIRPETLIFYRDIYDHTVRLEETLEGTRDVAESVLGTYLSSVNNRMNEVMKTFSVVTAIFLPLTLIASIFGTNLDYSSIGVTLEHGFFWMLVGMVVLAAAMVYAFRRRGWF